MIGVIKLLDNIWKIGYIVIVKKYRKLQIFDLILKDRFDLDMSI